jgi:hypothetical protein
MRRYQHDDVTILRLTRTSTYLLCSSVDLNVFWTACGLSRCWDALGTGLERLQPNQPRSNPDRTPKQHRLNSEDAYNVSYTAFALHLSVGFTGCPLHNRSLRTGNALHLLRLLNGKGRIHPILQLISSRNFLICAAPSLYLQGNLNGPLQPLQHLSPIF